MVTGYQRPARPGLPIPGLVGRAPGTGGSMRWFFSGIWLAYLAQPASDLFTQHFSAPYIAGGLAILTVFSGIYLPVVANAARWPRFARWGLPSLVMLAALGCVVYGKGATSLWIYVSAATGMVLASAGVGRRPAALGVVAVGACYVFFSWLSHVGPSDFFVVLLPVLFVGWVMIGFRRQMELMWELAEARETVAKMAVSEERLRLARDMHDLTGQSLSMITLKSELAAKRLTRLPPSAERDAVMTELGDIGRVSRQTLHDIRDAVSGYRRPTLAVEVITARNALDAAGIRLDDDPALTLRSGAVDADAEAALAWCLREAVTNVIRHSGARNCRIRLSCGAGELTLEVLDDGHGLPDRREPTGGNGLRGMSERLSGLGGRLSLGPADPEGFRLCATVPAVPVMAAVGTRENQRP